MSNKNKCASVPVPAAMWDGLKPQQQMAFVVMECAKFMASDYYQNFGGFHLFVVRSDESGAFKDTIMLVGREEAENTTNVILPPRGIIKPN